MVERGKCSWMNGGTNTRHDIKEFSSFAISFMAYQMESVCGFIYNPFPIFSAFIFDCCGNCRQRFLAVMHIVYSLITIER